MRALSETTWGVVRKMFPAGRHVEVGRYLAAECGNGLPFFDGLEEAGLERVRFAVLKLSNGDLDALLQAIWCAQTDWRDTLVAAGFGHDIAEHDRWAKDYLARNAPGPTQRGAAPGRTSRERPSGGGA